jgi:transketolase
VVLYDHVLRFPNGQISHPDRDRFILSKGHAALAFYAVLHSRDNGPVFDLNSFTKFDSSLAGHPASARLEGVETSTGPLGHGLPFGAGAALGGKLAGSGRRVFVLVGDGELQEGSNWEAAMLAASRRLDNLTLIIDRNGLQQGRQTEIVNSLEPLADKWRAFGWSVREIDGHDVEQISRELGSVPFEAGKPSCVIAHTVKGKGVSFMENNAVWHHKIPDRKDLMLALTELEAWQ